MLTKDSDSKPLGRRPLTIPFYLAVSVVVLICAMLTAGALVLSTTNNLEKSPREILNEWTSNNGWNASKGVRIRAALSKFPARYLASLGTEPEIPKLVIDIRFKHQESLRVKRETALLRGMLIQEEGDLVPANVRTDGRQVAVRLRLKGDQSDHFDSDKWSLRIEVKGDDHILGMRRFSLQHPKVRAYQAEPLFMETLRHSGVLAVRYQFVHVVINGEDKGIMALEEHFSKELLEHQARREGVFVRFDESNFWEFQRVGGSWRNSPYDNFRKSRISTFRAKKIEESPALSAQHQTAVGLLRSFAAGDVAASEVFDVDATASYLAVLELWGSWHSIQWNDMRFYFDPLTMKLEPIGYDANLELQPDLREITLKREPIYTALLRDPLIRQEYLKRIRQLSRDVVDGEFGVELAAIQDRLLSDLRYEFLLLEPLDLGNLADRANFMLELNDDELLRDPVSYPRRIRFPELIQANLINDQDGQYLELANMLFEPVTIKSIVWRNPETGVDTAVETIDARKLPFNIPPTIHGQTPNYERLYLSSEPALPGGELVITASYANWPQDKEIHPVNYLRGLTKSPIPDSTIEEQLERHPFLALGDESDSLRIRQGSWTVGSDIIVPPGFKLIAEAGTQLVFSADAALVSKGPLQFLGDKDNPIRLLGIESAYWQGLAVLGAGQESILRHVDIANTTGISRGAWQLTGGVSFYRSDVDMEDVSISHHDGEDALNIVRSRFRITRLNVTDTLSDGFDADFTTGELRDSVFSNIGHNSGGDAVDFSGSNVVLEGVEFLDIADKAVSVGEASQANASKLTMTRVGTAAASKDGSRLLIDDIEVNEAIVAGLMAYTKKPEYGPASIKASNIDYRPSGPVGRVQTGSEIELDGKKLPPEELDVDLLYETVMRKGT